MKKIIALVLSAAALAVWHARVRPAPSARSFVDGLPALTPDMRLVVARADFAETVAGENRKAAWGIDWGETKAVLTVPVRAHYALDLSGDEPVEFRIARDRRTLTAVFRDPEVQAVEIFADGRREVVQPGWGRLEALSGRALLDRLDRGVYDAAKAQAGAPAALARTREEARAELARLLASYLARAGMPAWTVAVRFRSDEGGFGALPPDGPGISYNLR
jgi:hypothetical protein